MERGLLILTPPLDVYRQMAADEYFCETMPARFLIRFFNWAGNGLTFGFSQRYRDVTSQIPEADKELPMTRRPTGGGMVFHKNDLTFSFIFHCPGDFNPYSTYEKIHTAINIEYAARGVPLEILNSRTMSYAVNNPAMDCFAKPVEKDLMLGGKKVLGGALRKFSDYMLYQASLQLDNSREKTEFHSEILTAALSRGYDLELDHYSVKGRDLEKIEELGYNKYMSEAWIKRVY